MLALGNSIYFNMNNTFDAELQQVRAEIITADQTLIKAKEMKLKAQQQVSHTSSIRIDHK